MAITKATTLQPVVASKAAPPGSHTNANEGYSAPTKGRKISFAAAYAGSGLSIFLISAYYLCTHRDLGDPELERMYKEQVNPNAYAWPMVAFATAFSLSWVTLIFERETVKFELLLLGCYISLLAGLTDFLGWMDLTPIVRDSYGQGFPVLRMVMWLLTTPAMVYLLSLVSDFSSAEVNRVMTADALMLCSGLIMHLSGNFWVALFMWIPVASFFTYVVYSMWRMFDASIAEACNESSKASLHGLRVVMVGLWFTFPIVWLLTKPRFVSINMEEWLWCIGDFLGKVMFSSSLLHSNFLSLDQRRMIAMRIIEEGNRLQVIKELQDLVEQKERFMSSMSHELRTPLNGIIGLSDALLVGSCGTINDAARRTINTIKTSGSRLLNLINDILDAASMRKGKLTIKQEKVSLNNVVDSVIELCQPLAKRGVKLVSDLPPGLPLILGDTGRIIQIFNNLIGNSCKFTHQGYISVSAVVKMDEVEVAVSDTGIGIPGSKFDQIFKAFEQVDMSTTRKYGGTGLGLNLVKQLVEAHEGSITVKSKEGTGTTFYFNLPLYPTDGLADHRTEQSNLPGAHHTSGNSVDNDYHSHSSNNMVRGGSSGNAQARHTGKSGSYAMSDHASVKSGGMDGDGPDRSRISGSQVANMQAAAAGATADGGSTLAAPSSLTAPAVTSMSAAEHAQQLSLGKPLGGSNKASGSGKAPSTGSVGAPAHGSITLLGGGASIPLQGATLGIAEAAAVVQSQLKRNTSFYKKDKNTKVRVLSVDDDPVNQMVIQSLLAPAGYEILQAMDGQEALEILKDELRLPDIVLLDVMMPGMSGYEVCRKLREMYPLAAIPVIMISAKSKEENIVEGLHSGSNDYVVKPFGRQEILARISAHLNFRDTVYQVGELAGLFPDDEIPKRVLLRGARGSPIDIGPYLSTASTTESLPLAAKSNIESGNTTTLQVFDELTLVEIGINNLSQLAIDVPASHLLRALADLYTHLDTLLAQHSCHLVECLEERIVVVAGLDGAVDHAHQAMMICKGVLEHAADVKFHAGGNTVHRLNLTFGMHSGAGQGVLIGHAHPGLYFTGTLPHEAHTLQETCPRNCVHVSNATVEACRSNKSSVQFVRAGKVAENATFLAKVGKVWEASIAKADELCMTWAKAPRSRYGGINTAAKRLKPIQLAMVALSQVGPGFLLDLAGFFTDETKAEMARMPSSGALASNVTMSSSVSPSVDGSEIMKLSKEKAAAESQLQEVTKEAERLQDVVDDLEEELMEAKAALEAAMQDAVTHAATQAATHIIAAEASAEAATVEQVAAVHAAASARSAAASAEAQLVVVSSRAEELERQLEEALDARSQLQQALEQANKHIEALLDRSSPAQQNQRYVMEVFPNNSSRAPPMRQASHASIGSMGSYSGMSMHNHSSVVGTQGMNSVGYGARGVRPSVSQSRLSMGIGMPAAYGGGGMGMGMGVAAMIAARPAAVARGNGASVSRDNSGGMSASSGSRMPTMTGGSMVNSNGMLPVYNLAGNSSSMGSSREVMSGVLHDLGLSGLVSKFEEEEITLDALPHMDDVMLKELGVASLGARVKLRVAAQDVLESEAMRDSM